MKQQSLPVAIACGFAALLLALVATVFMLACMLLALRLPAPRVSTRVFVSIAAGVAVAIAGALSFVPLALLLQLGRFTLPSVSRPLAKLEQLVYAVAIHEYTVVAILVALPAGALFAFSRSGGGRSAPTSP